MKIALLGIILTLLVPLFPLNAHAQDAYFRELERSGTNLQQSSQKSDPRTLNESNDYKTPPFVEKAARLREETLRKIEPMTYSSGTLSSQPIDLTPDRSNLPNPQVVSFGKDSFKPFVIVEALPILLVCFFIVRLGMRRRWMLRSISRKLAQLPSLAYALSYFALILVFAVIYSGMPHSFYHSTIQYEPSMEEARKEVDAILTADLKTYLNAEPDNDGFKLTGALLELKKTVPYENELKHREAFLFSLYLRKEYAGPDPLAMFDVTMYPKICSGSVEVVVSPPDPNVANTYNVLNKAQCIACLYPSDDFDGKRDLQEIGFEYHFDPQFSGLKDEGCVFFASEHSYDKLNAYREACNGFPSDVFGNFGRMLYFSTTTMTTLGYGDIVPISTAGRSLSAIQSFFGIVLIGLFLNALAFESNTAPSLDL